MTDMDNNDFEQLRTLESRIAKLEASQEPASTQSGAPAEPAGGYHHPLYYMAKVNPEQYGHLTALASKINKTPANLTVAFRNPKLLRDFFHTAAQALGYEFVQTGPLSFEFQPTKDDTDGK